MSVAGSDNGIGLLDVRLARLEERGDARDQRMSRIETALERVEAKVGVIASDIAEAKTTWQVSKGIAGHAAKFVPGGLAGLAAWVAAHFLANGR